MVRIARWPLYWVSLNCHTVMPALAKQEWSLPPLTSPADKSAAMKRMMTWTHNPRSKGIHTLVQKIFKHTLTWRFTRYLAPKKTVWLVWTRLHSFCRAPWQRGFQKAGDGGPLQPDHNPVRLLLSSRSQLPVARGEGPSLSSEGSTSSCRVLSTLSPQCFCSPGNGFTSVFMMYYSWTSRSTRSRTASNWMT